MAGIRGQGHQKGVCLGVPHWLETSNSDWNAHPSGHHPQGQLFCNPNVGVITCVITTLVSSRAGLLSRSFPSHHPLHHRAHRPAPFNIQSNGSHKTLNKLAVGSGSPNWKPLLYCLPTT